MPKFPTLNRHARRKAMSKQTPREVERIFELTFADIGSRLDLNEAQALALVVRRIASDSPPLCLTCDAVLSALDPPALVMLAKPFAHQGPVMVGAVCEGCSLLSHEDRVRACLQTFRNGRSNVRQVDVGRA